MYEALNYGAWSFATKTIELPPEENGTYTLPEDCLRPFKIDAPRYRIDGNKIIVEQSCATPGKTTLTLRYISNALAKAEHLPENQPLFVRGVSLLLVARMAVKITGESQFALIRNSPPQALSRPQGRAFLPVVHHCPPSVHCFQNDL